jgi:hypothetical protein
MVTLFNHSRPLPWREKMSQILSFVGDEQLKEEYGQTGIPVESN